MAVPSYRWRLDPNSQTRSPVPERVSWNFGALVGTKIINSILEAGG